MENFFPIVHAIVGVYLLWVALTVTAYDFLARILYQFLPAIGGIILLFEAGKGLGII